MNKHFRKLYLARHGETAWSLVGKHTGLTDLPLTEAGERNAQRLGERLAGVVFAKVFTSPLQRAARTCELAGFGGAAETDYELVEWDYGEYQVSDRWRFMLNARTGNCSATAARGRIARSSWRSGQSRGEPCARNQGGCVDVFQRSLSAGTRCPLAGNGTSRRETFYVGHSERKYTRIRKQAITAGDSVVERHPSSR